MKEENKNHCQPHETDADLAQGIAAYEAGAYGAAYPPLKRAAEAGNAQAQCLLGNLYYYGYSVPESHVEAAKWYRLAAEQGHARGQKNLGEMYRDGEGVPQSDEEAAAWFRRAAEQGDARGQYDLGVMYEDGRGVPQSDEEAAKWYRLAAEQGVPWREITEA